MANTVTITKLVEGARDVIFHVYLKSDGVTGDLVNQVIIDPVTSVSPPLPQAPIFTLTEVWYDLSGFTISFRFDDLVDKQVWLLSEAGDNHICFDKFGGLKDRSGIDGTGKLQISTTGFTTASDEGSFVIKVRKN